MSQQQPPPNQPDQSAGQQQPGGFGPPATPPPAPDTPPSAPPVPPGGQPGQPGYGYPQQPGQPTQPQQSPTQPQGQPAAPPQPPGPPPGPPPAPPGPPPGAPPAGTPGTSGFGAPAAPGPYRPADATPQPGWGTQPGVPPVPGAKRNAKTKIAVIVAAVLALLVGVGGAVVLLTGDDDKSNTAEDKKEDAGGGGGGNNDNGGGDGLPTEPINASLAWSTPAPEVTEEEIIQGARGAWIVDDTLVRTGDNAIVAYDIASGEEQWSVDVELSGGDCNASPNVSEDRIAVLQGRDCEVLTIIDIVKGKEVTSIPLDLESLAGGLTDTTYPAILGDTVAIGWGSGGAGYSISSGEVKWTQSAQEECPEVAYAVFDDILVSHRACGFLGEDGGMVRATDESGKKLWEWQYDPKYEGQTMDLHSVISIDPLIVTAWLDDDLEKETIFVIDEDYSEISHTLDYDPDRFQSPCQVNTLTDCKMAVLHDGFMYLASYPSNGNGSVVAFELSSGQALYEVGPVMPEGQQQPQGSSLVMRPFAVDDGKILAYQREAYDDTQPGLVVAIDPETEEATPVMLLDPEASEQEAAAGSSFDPHELRLLWHDNSLLMLTESFYEPDLEKREATMVFR